MTRSGNNWFTITLGVAVVLLVALCAKLYWDYSILHLRVEFAREQIEIFNEMLDKALKSDAPEAAGCLNYAMHYYPSGTKQLAGSKLDQIVESHRASVADAIIAYLRAKTGENLGNDPEMWIEKYEKK